MFATTPRDKVTLPLPLASLRPCVQTHVRHHHRQRQVCVVFAFACANRMEKSSLRIHERRARVPRCSRYRDRKHTFTQHTAAQSYLPSPRTPSSLRHPRHVTQTGAHQLRTCAMKENGDFSTTFTSNRPTLRQPCEKLQKELLPSLCAVRFWLLCVPPPHNVLSSASCAVSNEAAACGTVHQLFNEVFILNWAV